MAAKPKTKRQMAAALLGKAGGLRRAQALTPERRREIAVNAGRARQAQRKASLRRTA